LRFIGDKGIIFLAEPVESDAVPKRVPDFESVSAVYVTLEQLNELKDDDFRDGDPQELYPSIDSGSLTPHSLEKTAFLELESQIRTFEKGQNLADTQIWTQLKEVYPEDIFFDFY